MARRSGRDGWSREGRRRTERETFEPTAGSPAAAHLWPLDARLLGLLAEHEVLTTRQLQRLTDGRERTVQHRLGLLAGQGLAERSRPRVPRGSSPYLCWLTPLGAAVVGAVPMAWDRSTARVRAVAVLNELRQTLDDPTPGVEGKVVSWQRTPDGLRFNDRGRVRRLATDVRFTAHVADDGTGVAASGLVFLDTGALPGTRLGGPLVAFSRYLATRRTSESPGEPPWLLVVTRSAYRAGCWLTAADDIGDTGHGLAAGVASESAGRVAVTVETVPSPRLAQEAVWQQPHGRAPVRLAELLRGDARAYQQPPW